MVIIERGNLKDRASVEKLVSRE